MSNRSVLKQTLNAMKNQFTLFQVDGLDHRINHREHPLQIPVSHHVHIITPRGDDVFDDPARMALFIEDLKSFDLESVILPLRQRFKILAVCQNFLPGQGFGRFDVVNSL